MPRKVEYRPPISDSEDEYDGFYFGDSMPKSKSHVAFIKSLDRQLIEAIDDGDLAMLKEKLESSSINVDAQLEGGLTLLLHSCCMSQVDIVRYLLEEKHADINKEIGSITPIIAACDSSTKNSDRVGETVLLLIEHNAAIGEADLMGTTPLMFACKRGHLAAVRLLLSKSSINATDKMGCTALFLAVESNKPDIVRLLIEAGADVSITNNKGYTPLQVAQFHGFNDLLEILPIQEEKYCVPTEYLGYNTIRDHIPRIFLKTECPEYFQEIAHILLSHDLENYTEYFAKGRISFAEFLNINDEKLNEIGILLPIHKMKIKKVLLDYHLHHWSIKTIRGVHKSSHENFYAFLLIAANQLQNLVTIGSSLRFIRENLQLGVFGAIQAGTLAEFKSSLHDYRTTIKDILKTVQYLSSFSPLKNPVHIDYDDILAERKRRKLHRYFKYTTIIVGLTIFACLKVKRLFR